jgi:CheY-like chemotaxis protein
MANILVIDDDEQYPFMLAKTLRNYGHNAYVASDGVKALKMCESQTFDLIITDIFMPDMDGFEFLNEAKHRNFQVPIIAISGGCKMLQAQLMLSIIASCGAKITLTKPFTEAQLLGAVNVALNSN